MRVPSAGGKAEIVVAPDGKNEIDFEGPTLLPGGKLLLFNSVGSKGFGKASITVLDLRTHVKKAVVENAGFGQFARTGARDYIIYARGGSLFAVPFDLSRIAAGSPVPVLEGVNGASGFGFFGFSRTGTLAYYAGKASDAILVGQTPVLVDRQGNEQPMPVKAGFLANLRFSPDGGRIAFDRFDAESVTADVWVFDVSRATTTPFTFTGLNSYPVWTPDGKRLIYATFRNLASFSTSIKSALSDGSGQPETLVAESNEVGWMPVSISPDGKTLLMDQAKTTNSNGPYDIVTLALNRSNDSNPREFIATPFSESQAHFPPDGHWVAYQSNASGKDQVYVVPFPGPGGKRQVSTDGGTSPRWNRNGRELFYRDGNKMMAVEVETGASFRAGTPKILFEKSYGSNYDVSPDGKRFVTLKNAAPPGQSGDLHVVLNWFEELRQRVPAR